MKKLLFFVFVIVISVCSGADASPISVFSSGDGLALTCVSDVINNSAEVQRHVIPEPGTMFLLCSLATGLFGVAGLKKRFTK